MSHELRTPLNSLLILAKLLSDNPEANLTDKQVEYAKTIYASGSDLLALINEILDLSKVEAGKMPVEPREVALDDIADFVERSFRPSPSRRTSTSRPTSTSSCPTHIHTDPQRLQQVLKNLLSNALQVHRRAARSRCACTGRKPGTRFANEALRERAASSPSRSSTPASASPRDKQQLIFEAFQQADGTTSRKYGGTGLGLSISREIARLLGGEIHVESDAGRGQHVHALPARAPRRRRPTRRGAAVRRLGAAHAELRRTSSAHRRRWPSPTRS